MSEIPDLNPVLLLPQQERAPKLFKKIRNTGPTVNFSEGSDHEKVHNLVILSTKKKEVPIIV